MENLLIKTLFFLLIGTGVALSGYIVGYKHGGADFGYLERVLNGVVIHSEARQCEGSDQPQQCFHARSELRTADALDFYADYNERLSPLARHLFPRQHSTYRSAVSRIFTRTAREGPKAVCEPVEEFDREQFVQCQDQVLKFLKTAKHADYTQLPRNRSQ